MHKRYEDPEFPFEDMDEIDQDGFTDYYNTEDLYNSEFMQSNRVYPPKGSFTNIPSNAFALPGLEVEETIKAIKKLNEYDDSSNMKNKMK